MEFGYTETVLSITEYLFRGGKGRFYMRRMIERIAAATAIIALSWSGISMYRGYIAEKIYEESVRNLEATYGQVSQTFRLFTQRNWNVLSAYQELLEIGRASCRERV